MHYRLLDMIRYDSRQSALIVVAREDACPLMSGLHEQPDWQLDGYANGLYVELKDDAVQTYQALLARADNVVKVRQMRRAVEDAGGKVEMAPPTATGMVRVTLWLPLQYQPRDFFPDLPFYPF